MKRHLFSVVLVVLLILPVSSLASKYPDEYDTETGIYCPLSVGKRNAFDFCDQFLIRSDLLTDYYGIDTNYSDTVDYCAIDSKFLSTFNSLAGENQYYAQLRAGGAYINMPDFTIERLDCQLVTPGATKDDRLLHAFRASVAVSALEYTGADDLMIQVNYSMNHELPDNAVIASLDLYQQFILPKYNDKAFLQKVFEADMYTGVLCYSGNYDYYIRGFSSDEGDFLYLTAIAK